MTDTSRRAFIQGTAAVSLLAIDTAARAAATPAEAAAAPVAPAAPAAPAFGYQHAPIALPFDAKSLRGISEKLITSHWENNYTGAVKALNLVRGRLQQAGADAALPPYLYAGLKREQLIRTGSVVYHELYFRNLGGSGQAGAKVRSAIARSFGSYDAWESEFRRIGQGLGGGSGWVMLAWNPALKLMENYALADHGQGSSGSVPLLMMDMYEHAYQMDYGAAAAKYVDAFFANVQWDAVEARLGANGG